MRRTEDCQSHEKGQTALKEGFHTEYFEQYPNEARELAQNEEYLANLDSERYKKNEFYDVAITLLSCCIAHHIHALLRPSQFQHYFHHFVSITPAPVFKGASAFPVSSLSSSTANSIINQKISKHLISSTQQIQNQRHSRKQ